MVLRDKSRAADPRKVAMAASDQPVKKKQRIDGPDIDESSVGSNGDIDIFNSEGLVDETRNSVAASDEFLNTVRESPDSGTVSEDAVDCASVILETRRLDESFQLDKPLPHNSSQASNLNGSQRSESILTSDFEVLQNSLLKQCLCHLAEEVLRRPFHDHLKMSSWPSSKMLRFLSNLQLLFDVYLKQNNTGTICSRISHICDALVRNEYNWIMEVMELADHKSKFVNYLAGRVLSSFFIVAKDSIDQNWLQQIVDNVYLFDSFNRITVQKINFSLDIIKRIVEWKNVDQHPLEETTMTITHVQHRQQSMADNPNPFGSVTSYSTAPHYSIGISTSLTDSDTSLRNSDILQNAFSHLNTFNSSSNSCSSSSGSLEEQRPRERAVFKLHEPIFKFPSTSQSETPEVMIDKPADENNGRIESVNEQGCSTVILTDSESFDTSHIKYLTIKSLELHWPILMKNIKLLLTRYLNISNAENCILTFLSLWEIIISVKANLSVIDTKPFYADLHSFVDLLRCTTLPSLIYTQLLGLFNEVLCYGSTLALQDMLPEEICTLAHSIVRFVKDFRLLSDVQIRHSSTGFGFIGFESTVLREYSLDAEDNNHAVSLVDPSYGRDEITSELPTRIEYETNPRPHNEVDKTMLQKMSLLVLKSIAVTVKEMRCDSSDSSIDSSDYNAIQDMQIVERSIRDVLKKLDVFIKNALEFHPETAFTKILIHLFSEQDDYLIESMVCTLDITVGVVYRNSMYPDLISMLNPMLTFIEFLKVVSHDSDVLLDYLVSNETCFLLYLLRFLKYVRRNWSKFVETCQNDSGSETRGLDETMTVLIRLRLQISRLVSKSLFPYNISPVLRLLEVCESLYEGNELS